MTSRFFLLKSIDGFVLHCQSRRLSIHTIRDYSGTLRKLEQFVGDIPINDITTTDLRNFLSNQKVSKKTLYNYHIGLSIFFKWCVSETLIKRNPLEGIPRAKPEQRVIEPIPVDHIRKIIDAAERVSYIRGGKIVNQFLPDRYKNRAIILLLLDTGLRATELCTIEMKNLDLDRMCVKIIGKLSKERILYYSPTTAKSIWKYIDNEDIYLFPGTRHRPMSRHSLRNMLYRVCDRANVPRYSPHDFRHTFAINFLRNYPNIYVLQQMLGHSTLDMVKHYLSISEIDIARAQKLASPVENWGL